MSTIPGADPGFTKCGGKIGYGSPRPPPGHLDPPLDSTSIRRRSISIRLRFDCYSTSNDSVERPSNRSLTVVVTTALELCVTRTEVADENGKPLQFGLQYRLRQVTASRLLFLLLLHLHLIVPSSFLQHQITTIVKKSTPDMEPGHIL